MLDFALVLGAQPDCISRDDLTALLPDTPDHTLTFSVGDQHLVAFWSDTHPHRDLTDRVALDRKGFRLLAGYPLNAAMKPLRSIDAFDPSDPHHGDYFYLAITPGGDVIVDKSTLCSYQLYVAKLGSRQVLASRASLAAAIAHDTLKPPLNADFARWACTYGIGGNTAAVFAGTDTVLFNQSIQIANAELTVTAPDHAFLLDGEAARRHQNAPRAYWDDVHDHLVAAISVLDLSDQPIDFPLSGGKDSRLLLSLLIAGGYRDRIRRVFTTGPHISPEVRAAKLVCEALDLDHEFIDSTNTVRPTAFTIDRHLPQHARVTEAEMSPMDPTWSTSKSAKIELHGQEGGLRNISMNRDNSSRDALLNWFAIHLERGDKCGIYAPGIADQNMDEVSRFVDEAIEAGVRPDDIANLHRITYRLCRWVSRTWRAYNDRYFAPYVFVDQTLVKATFNAGAQGRIREELHFEMLRRLAPDLIEVPLAQQTWDTSLAAAHDLILPDPLTWPEGTRPQSTRPTHQSMFTHFDAFKSFFAAHDGPVTSALIDRERLAAITNADLHASHYQALWQMVQIALFERIPDLAALASDTPASGYGLPSFDYQA